MSTPGGQHTDAYQKNDNLMLSDHARADPLPGLEILASEGNPLYARCDSRSY